VILIAFDLSLSSIGVAHHDGTAHRISSHLGGPERLAELRDNVIACANTPPADLVVIEGQSYGHNGRGHAELAGLHCLVRVALWERDLPYFDVPPSTLKQYATGKGNASKEDVHEAAIRRLGYRGASRDEADALWLWAAAMDWYGHPVADMPATNRKALAKLAWPALTPPQEAAG
jgi:crossover junction endodeoxyribonuclease RuvC